MIDETRTFDLTLVVSTDPSVLEEFLADVVELAERFYPGIEPRSIDERRDPQRRPRVGRPRVHAPPRHDRNDNDAADGAAERSTP